MDKKKKKQGFSIVELLIVLAIFGVITSIILAKNGQFNNVVKLENLAYEIALTVRQAQIFGTSVKGVGEGTQTFDVGYGVHFGSGNSSTFILFADRNGDKKYSGSNEAVEILNMGGGNEIEELCVITSGTGTKTCGGINKELNISFIRPNYTAVIKTDVDTSGGPFKTAEVHIVSPSGEQKTISTKVVGQISVE